VLVIELLVVDIIELLEEVLLGAVIPSGAQVAPKSAAFLKVSAKEPLDTPYLVPTVEEIA
jgi:hypothetical protein